LTDAPVDGALTPWLLSFLPGARRADTSGASPYTHRSLTLDNIVIYGVHTVRIRIAPSEAQGKGKPKGGNFPTELSG